MTIRRLIQACLLLCALSAPFVAAQSTAPAAPVTAANWYWGPVNRWSWHNTRRIFPSATVSRGHSTPVPLPQALRDFSSLRFTDPVTRQPMTLAQMLDATYTDGFLVLQHGHILAETYRNGMTADDPHLIMSVSKSVMGTLAGVLVGRGQLDPAKLVTGYVPEMKGTLYDGATIRNLLDMTVDDPQARAASASTDNTVNEYQAMDEAGGWLPRTAASAPGFRAYLTGLHRPHGENGRRFQYLDQSAILIGWVMERASGKDLAQLLSDEIWSQLGAEQDAYLLLDPEQQAYSSAGFNATLRDLARFGQMIAQNGSYNGRQIVPKAWIEDIRANGPGKETGPDAPAPWPGHAHGTYRSFWWMAAHNCGRLAGVGLGGQLLIVDPIADMVVVKFDSTPRPELDDKVFATEYRGIDVLIQAVSGHGCP